MPLTIGETLGSYEILSVLGAGGMGEVYRARDTKLGRDVAIKVLPEELARHPEKLARFDREARLLASLNHPGIATLHGFETHDDIPFLVMELVEGETLAERIARGPLPVKEAMTLAGQIAEALEVAHERGVIHRDLKPANIEVDAEGRVKLLDFGLAKAFGEEVPESNLSQSPTLSRDETRAGVILGTAAYMSPEQARGKAVDKRTDIFSFGLVLYEMLTGKKAFTGEDVSDVLAAVIRSEPDWKALPASVPPSVTTLLRRCLTKDRKQRLQAIGEARIAAERYLTEPDAATPSGTPAPPRAIAWQVVAGLLAIALLLSIWRPWIPATTEPTLRLSVELGAGPVRFYPGPGGAPALSPDGTMLAFLGTTAPGNPRGSEIHVRPLDAMDATPLSGTEGAFYPLFSPDGQWVAFYADGVLRKVPVSGGAAMTIAEAPLGGGAAWGPDDTIVYGDPNGGLHRVPASGGTPVELTVPADGEVGHSWPLFLPNGKAVAFTVQVDGGTYDDATIEAVLLDSGERKVLHRGGLYPRYAASGHLLYVREGTLFAAPFDVDRVELTGEARPVVEGVRSPGRGAALFAVADNGALVYAPDLGDAVENTLVWVDREGNASPISTTAGDWETPRLSPDGRRLAVRRADEAEQQIRILELSRGTLTRLTFRDGLRPLWSPDGETIFFSSARTGGYEVFSKTADGSGPAEQRTTGPMRVPSSITSDGSVLVFRQGGDSSPFSPTSLDVGVLRLEEGAEPEMLLETTFDEHTPKLSPDDRWLAYVSNESGRDEVYVTRFPTGGKWQISTEGGREPAWSRDGRELFYRNGEKMMAVDVSEGPDSPGKPVMLFEGPYALKEGSGASNYDVAEDGRFVMIQTEATTAGTHVTLVLNWHEELKRLVPTE